MDSFTPSVRQTIARFLFNPSLYSKAWETLERKYGNPALIIEAAHAAIDALPFWKDYDYAGLRHFSSELNGILGNLRMVGGDLEIACSRNLRRLVVKMPPRLADEWGDHLFKILPQKATLTTLADWLDGKLASRYVIGKVNNFKQEKPTATFYPRNVFSTSTSASIVDTAATSCLCCHGHHNLSSCSQFQGLPIEKRDCEGQALLLEYGTCE